MMAEPIQPIEIFYSYAHKDEKMREELNKYLFNLKRQGLINDWHDRNISAGTEWAHEIDTHLNSAQLILLLISTDFMVSDYCYSIEMERALERHNAGEARVIPIILKPADWEGAPFAKLQMLPKNAKAVTRWHPQAEGYDNITKGIKEVLKELKRDASNRSTQSATTPKQEIRTSTIVEPSSIVSSYEEDTATTDVGPVWSVPYRRNPFFTGREKILEDLRNAFVKQRSPDTMAIQALSGLGGMGKTQTAIEYAYRHRENYHIVLWAQADSLEALVSDYVRFATLLNLPGKLEQDQKYAVDAVKRWLETHTDWLLILDNVEDPKMVYDYLPATPQGHILLTTRTQVLGGLALRLDVEKMTPEEGAFFLLRRANMLAHDTLDIASEAKRTHALAIAELLDGLPLAIDQAAAYIEETGVLANFVDIYERRRADLLKKRGGGIAGHPDPVATTWSLSFEKVEQANPAAAELLRFLAFLHPDTIPDALLKKGAPHLKPLLQTLVSDSYELNQAIGELRKYSLVRRNPDEATLSLHRLVQEVQRDSMDEQTQLQWIEQVINTVNEVFTSVDFATWKEVQQYVPQAQQCFIFIQQHNIQSPEAAKLLNEVGHFLDESGQYADATSFLEQALTMREQVLGKEHLDVAQSLNNLAEHYRYQARYADAEPLYQRALAIRQQELGFEHPDVATSLNNLARPYHHLVQYAEAKSLYEQALAIRKRVLGSKHPDVADTLNDLALLYYDQGEYIQAKQLYEQALSIREQVLGLKHPDTANSLSGLASNYHEQGEHTQAKPLYEQALAIYEQVLGPKHPDTAGSLNNLATTYQSQGEYVWSKSLYERALAICEQVLGPKHPTTANSLAGLAGLYTSQGEYVWSKSLYERALAIYEQVLGPKHPTTAKCLNNLGSLYVSQKNYIRAEQFIKRALAICEQVLGPEHPDTVKVLINYAQFLRVSNHRVRAEEMEAWVKEAQAKRSQEAQSVHSEEENRETGA